MAIAEDEAWQGNLLDWERALCLTFCGTFIRAACSRGLDMNKVVRGLKKTLQALNGLANELNGVDEAA